MEDLNKIQEFFSKPLEEGKQLDQVDFAKVVQAVTKTGHPVTVLLVPAILQTLARVVVIAPGLAGKALVKLNAFAADCNPHPFTAFTLIDKAVVPVGVATSAKFTVIILPVPPDTWLTPAGKVHA